MKTFFLFLSLSIGLCQAQKLKSLDLGVCDTIPKNLYAKRCLKKLSIYNGMGYCVSPVKVLSSKIARLKSLEYLSYESSYTFAALPPEVLALNKLKHLSTSDIIPEISELTALTSLNITVGDAKELADLKALSFEKLVNLESLAIKLNGRLNIEENDRVLFGLEKLTKLKHLYFFNVDSDLLVQVPPLPSLTSLNLSGVQGHQMIDFSQFPLLDTLMISRADELKTIPSALYQLQHLSKLTIRNSGLESIPEGISALKNLKDLDLNSNKITGLPNDLADLKSLEILSLGRNFNVNKLPENMGNLSNLKRLIVNSCGLSQMPESITKLTQLEILFFSVNDLTDLPKDWSAMASLKTVNLERNKLETIPEDLLKIETLEVLSLNNNALSAANFKNNSLPIAGLGNLKKLDLQFNQLEAIPHDIGSLKNLEDLNIYYNQITELPTSIGDIGQLKSLSMGHNKVSKFPESMTNLKIYEFSFHTNAFKSAIDIRTNFPKVDRTWTDKEFETELSTAPKIAKEIYFR